MPKSKEQNKEIRESRKKQIKAIALELFAKEGYSHVSISALAKKAGISKGLMYNYFESKEELLKSIISGGIDEIILYFDPNHDGVLSEEEFSLFIKKTFQLMKSDKAFWLSFFRLLIQPNVLPLIKESSMVIFMNSYFEMFEHYFIKKGFKEPALEVLHLSVLIEGLGMMLIFYDDLTDISDELIEKFENRIITMYS